MYKRNHIENDVVMILGVLDCTTRFLLVVIIGPSFDDFQYQNELDIRQRWI